LEKPGLALYSPECVEGEFSVVGIAPFPEQPKPTALLADENTGMGKNLPYLVPAALLSGSRMVISTATKALQHQLVGKNLPSALPHPYEESVPDTFALPCAAFQGRFKAGGAA
jgi:Rad3-related DNA helicase